MKIKRFISIVLFNKGFTLLEVVISIAILSIGMISVSNMQMTSYRVNFASNKLTTATLTAQSLVEELMSIKFNDPMLRDLTEEGVITSYEYRPGFNKFLTTDYEYDMYKGLDLRWEVDNKSNGTKAINVIATWQGMKEEKTLIFPLQRSVQQSIE